VFKLKTVAKNRRQKVMFYTVHWVQSQYAHVRVFSFVGAVGGRCSAVGL
jgi:hypothetical protein